METATQPQHEEDPSSERSEHLKRPAEMARHLAYLMEQGALTPGEIASLRRCGHDEGDLGIAFWKVAALYLEPYGHLDVEREGRTLRSWQAILRALADLHPLHRRKRALGAALAAAGVSEMRLLRLLRAEGEALHDALRAATHQLASAGEPVDLGELAWLLLTRETGAGLQVRRRIAGHYYRQLSRQQKTA